MAKSPARKRKLSAPQQDRRLRERIALAYADPNIEITIQIANLEKLLRWIKDGTPPPGTKPDLRVVEGKAV